MGLAIASIVFILGIIGAAVSQVLADDIKLWLETMAGRALKKAVKHLPPTHQERYDEEWNSYLQDFPGSFTKLAIAIQCIFASHKIASYHRASLRNDLLFGEPLFNFVSKALLATLDAISTDKKHWTLTILRLVAPRGEIELLKEKFGNMTAIERVRLVEHMSLTLLRRKK